MIHYVTRSDETRHVGYKLLQGYRVVLGIDSLSKNEEIKGIISGQKPIYQMQAQLYVIFVAVIFKFIFKGYKFSVVNLKKITSLNHSIPFYALFAKKVELSPR